MARLGRASCYSGRGLLEDAPRKLLFNFLVVVLTLEFITGINLIAQTSALKMVAPAMSPSQGWRPVRAMVSQAKVDTSISMRQQRQQNLYSSSVHPPISAPSYSSISGASDISFYSSDLSDPLVQHNRRSAADVPAHVDAAPPDAASNTSAAPSGLVQPPVSPHNGCCAPNMVQRRGSRDCHCVYPVRVELFLRNVSLTSNWSNEFLEELASQLNLRATQFEIVNFYVVGASGLNTTMDIAPHTGISFSDDQVTAMNYSLSLHTVRINPVLVGDYNLLNLTWFGPLAPAPAPAFTISPKASPSTASTLPRLSEDTSNDRHLNLITVICICIGALIGVLVIVLFICFCAFRKGKKKVPPVETHGMPGGDVYFEGVDHPNAEEDEDEESTSCQPYSYKILEAATCHFSNSNKLGSGGFGTVYRGTLENGKEVAAKRLKDSKRSLVELEREVSIVAKLRHQNLVRFLGYCFEDEGRLLVYEYLPNNSLDKFWNKGYFQCQRLDWATWFGIIKGVARGLQFLHGKGIIHRDLKAENVLLDENFNPKIADFDLLRVYNKDRTHESTQKVAGTFGYMAPECTSGGKYQLSIKSDVYSYGVLVLEIVTGRKIHTFEGHNSEGLVEYVWQYWTERRACDVVDSDLDVEAAEEGQRQALRCVHVALLCVQSDRSRRPTMGEVIAMVSTHQDSELQAPSLPGYLHPKSASGRALRPLPCFGVRV